MGQAEHRDRVVQVYASQYMQNKKVLFSKHCHSLSDKLIIVAVCKLEELLPDKLKAVKTMFGIWTVAVCQFNVGLVTVAVCQSRGSPRTVAVCQFNNGFVTVCQSRLSSRTVDVFQSRLKCLIVILGQWLLNKVQAQQWNCGSMPVQEVLCTLMLLLLVSGFPLLHMPRGFSS